MPVKGTVRTTIYLSQHLYAESQKKIPNLSAFVQEMLEREFAGEFNQLKIDEAEKNLELLKSQNSKIQTKKLIQKERGDANLQEILAERLAERRAWGKLDRKKAQERVK